MTPRDLVMRAIADLASPEVEVSDAATLAEIGMDSLDLLQLTMHLEERLSILILERDDAAWRTVGDVIAYAERRAGEAA